jgi:enterochelin esterase-like enzyme
MMERLIREGRIRPALVVGIWNTGVSRAAEYVPQKALTQGWIDQVPGAYSKAHLAVQSDAYLRFLVTELKPWVDRTYRTEPGPADTFILGSSMGGLISAYALAEYPGVFGGAACLSTHWLAGDGAVIGYLAAHLPPPGAHRLYFDYGTRTLDAQYEPYQLRMDAAMRRAGYREGVDWVTRKFPGDDHSEVSWRRRLDQPLEFLLGG